MCLLMHIQNSFSKSVFHIPEYAYFHQHSSRVSVQLRNLTCRPVTIKARTMVASITAAHIVQPM